MNKDLNSIGINKKPEDTTVVVAMSGGVDSSTVAGIMKNEGYKVIGITLKLYDDGKGLVERLVRDFKRFDDHSIFENEKVYFLKLAQLAFWGIHRELSKRYFYIEDMENMTAFADYIIPVALESFGIVKYSSELKEKIDSGILIDKDSTEEIEIRSTSIYATAKLTELINNYKKEEEKIIIPQLDFKIWTDFHADERPHHLTKTIMY